MLLQGHGNVMCFKKTDFVLSENASERSGYVVKYVQLFHPKKMLKRSNLLVTLLLELFDSIIQATLQKGSNVCLQL